jgi:hypothetical protein
VSGRARTHFICIKSGYLSLLIGRLKLLHTPSLEESGVSRVLFNISGVTLFSGVDFALLLRRVFADFGIVASSFLASVSGRHGRQFIVTPHIVYFLYSKRAGDDRPFLFTSFFANV